MFSQVVRNSVLFGHCQVMIVSWKDRGGHINTKETISTSGAQGEVN